MTVGDLDAAERSRVPRDHFDEPDKSCYAGYGCTDDCPVGGRGRQVPVRPFLHWPDVTQETHAEGPPVPEPRQPLPRACLRAPWRARAGARARRVGRVVFGLVVCCVVAFLASLTVQLCCHLAEGAANSRPAKDMARIIATDVLSHVQTYLKEHP